MPSSAANTCVAPSRAVASKAALRKEGVEVNILSAAPVLLEGMHVHSRINQCEPFACLNRRECRAQNEKKTSKKPLIHVIYIQISSTSAPCPMGLNQTVWSLARWAAFRSSAGRLIDRSGQTLDVVLMRHHQLINAGAGR